MAVGGAVERRGDLAIRNDGLGATSSRGAGGIFSTVAAASARHTYPSCTRLRSVPSVSSSAMRRRRVCEARTDVTAGSGSGPLLQIASMIFPIASSSPLARRGGIRFPSRTACRSSDRSASVSRSSTPRPRSISSISAARFLSRSRADTFIGDKRSVDRMALRLPPGGRGTPGDVP